MADGDFFGGILSGIGNATNAFANAYGGGDPASLYGNYMSPAQLDAIKQRQATNFWLNLAANSGPSRTPHDMGVDLARAGLASQGAGDDYMRSLMAGQQFANAGLQNTALQQGNQLRGFDIDYYRKMQQAIGGPRPDPMAPSPGSGLLSGSNGGGLLSGSGGAGNSGMEGTIRGLLEQPEGTTVKIPGAASGATMTLTKTGADTGSGSSVNPQTAAAVNAPPPSQQRPGAAPLFDLPSLVRQYNIARSAPAGQQQAASILSLIEKGLPEGAQFMSDGSIQARPGYDQYQLGKSLSEKGFQQTSNGTWQLAPGYAAGQGQIAGAEAWAKAPSEIYVNSQRPAELRGPGSVRYDPSTQTWVQVPNEINTVDPNSGAHFQQFTPLGLTQGRFGGGILSGNNGGGILAGNPGGAMTAPLARQMAMAGPPTAFGSPAPAMSAPASSPAPASSSSLPASTGPRYQTQLSPARLHAEEGLGTDFATKDKKAYDSATASLGGLYQVNAAVDRMNQTGGWASPGSMSDTRFALAKFANTVSAITGTKPNFDPMAVSSYENAAKEVRRMGMDLVNSEFGGQREAASIIQSATSSVPSAENTYLGFRLVSSSVGQMLQRQQDLYSFKADRLANGGSLLTAERDFNKANPPENYVRRAIANAIPDAAVTRLKQVGDKANFDKTFGDGMADYVLGGQRTGLIGIR